MHGAVYQLLIKPASVNIKLLGKKTGMKKRRANFRHSTAIQLALLHGTKRSFNFSIQVIYTSTRNLLGKF